MSKIHIEDPVEKIVADALDNNGIRYIHDSEGKGLDFELPDHGIFIEVKAFHSERSLRQLASAKNVILIQGKGAAETFSKLLSNEKRRETDSE